MKAIRLLLVLAVLFYIGCGKKAPKVEPQAEPEKLEQVEEPVVQVEKPVLTEEEIFQQKSIEELNKESNLKMVHFDFDRYDIKEEMKPVLQENADWLLKFKSAKFLIEGHCDERGTVEYNMALGEKRAEAVKGYLVALGVEAGRIQIISYGKNSPLVVRAASEDDHYRNRRAQFVITAK